ncbi:MAG: molybdopterin converting factor subunit 1 [Candidatus Hydrothermarchaeota archaeon]|nr:molybdopterin converting factor subunit 1 [Candidatus Hydrothermarchaeota archaeon]
MNVKLKFFASFRRITGTAVTELQVPEGTTTGDLFAIVKEMYEGFDEKKVLYAVNGEYVGEEVRLKEGDAIAFFPPVSGG